MSEYITIEHDGLYRNDWDGDCQEYVATRLEDDESLRALRSACRIGDGVTLLELMKGVDALPLLKAFIADYSWCGRIDEFHAQVQEPMRTESDGHSEHIEYLEIYHDANVSDFDGEVSVEPHCGFHGIGKPGTSEYHDGRQRYSVSLTPMYDLADLPVKLNEEFTIYLPWKPGDAPEEKVLLAGTGCFSLLEVLDAIYDDISFYGGPAEAREFLEEMRDTVEKIKSGEMKTVPLEDVLKQLDSDTSP